MREERDPGGNGRGQSGRRHTFTDFDANDSDGPPSRSRRTTKESLRYKEGSSRAASPVFVERDYPKTNSDGTRPLVVNINLGSKAIALEGIKWNLRASSWAIPLKISEQWSKLNIVSSTGFSDSPDDTFVELKCDTEWGEQDKYFLRWTHLQQFSQDFDEFAQRATQIPDLSEETVIVVDRLLTTVKKELERDYAHGKYLNAGSIRCDGQDPKNVEKEDATALFMCTPYFSFEELSTMRRGQSATGVASNLHPVRTLLQWQYDGESTHDRDSTQALKTEHGSLLHVPTLWCLIIGSEIMLTSAHVSIEELMEPTISKVPKPLGPDKGRLVQVADPYKRQYFFPMENCKTYFELRQLIQAQCLEDIGLDIDECELALALDESLTATRWISIVNGKSSTLVVISVTEKLGKKDRLALMDGDDAVSANTEGSSESEHEEPEPEEEPAWVKDPKAWQVSIRRKSTMRSEDRKTPRNAKTVKKLERQGLIVNNPASLSSDKKAEQNKAENVKMFHLDSTAAERTTETKKAEKTDESSSTFEDSGKEKTPKSPSSPPQHSKAKNVAQASSEPPKITLRIQPFFTWHLEESSDSGAKQTRQAADIDLLQKILGRLHRKLYDRDHNITELDLYGVEDEFRNARSYRETDEIQYSKLELLKADYSKSHVTQDQNSATLSSEDATSTPTDQSKPATQGGLELLADPNEIMARSLQNRIADTVKVLIRLSEDVVACFAPMSFDHQLMRKVWGALAAFITVSGLHAASLKLTDIVRDQVCAETTTKGKVSDKAKETWLVRDTWIWGEAKITVPVPLKSYQDCGACSSFTTYDSSPDAIKHLFSVHYPGRTDFSEKERKAIQATVVRLSTMTKLQSRSRTLRFLNRVDLSLKLLHSKVYDMVEALANINKEDPSASITFGLPSSLVHAFEHFFNFITASARVMPLMDRNYSGWTPTNSHAWGDRLSNYAQTMSYLGFRAENALSNAMKDFVLLIRKGEAAESVNYTAVGPRYIAFTFLRSLLFRKLAANDGIVELYSAATSKLQYQVLHRTPRRRLLADIQALEEEISGAQDIRMKQDDCAYEAIWNCCPVTFRITSQSRAQQYDLEGYNAGKQLLDRLRNDRDQLYALQRKLKDLRAKARYRIEVLEEDNSKAIFVFTVVTAVFLPLSFVTSYLGMNTADIRSTTTGQSTFWAISLPMTFVVVTLAITVAYKGDAVVDWMHNLRRRFTKPTSQRGRRRRLRQQPNARPAADKAKTDKRVTWERSAIDVKEEIV